MIESEATDADRWEGGGRGRILVVDDEPRVLRLLMRVMRANGFDVRCAFDATRGLELLDPQYDLVLLDLLMPGQDGFAMLRRIRAERPDVAVIVLSGVAEVDTKVRCFELGAADYVTKPFAMAELLARIRALRSRTGGRESRWLHDGALRLDLHSHQAITDGKVVWLSARECALLAHLMRREGHVCTRAELLTQVWGYSFDPGTNVVDVYVRRLRAKLGDQVVETVRSVGYSCGVL
jgi:two-component system, OmpR family, response regulator